MSAEGPAGRRRGELPHAHGARPGWAGTARHGGRGKQCPNRGGLGTGVAEPETGSRGSEFPKGGRLHRSDPVYDEDAVLV
jgi:hypothetical protein